MVLAAWVKKKQYEQGLEQSRAEERERTNAKMRAWVKDAMEAQRQGRPIHFDQLPFIDETESKNADSLAKISLMMLTILPSVWDYLRK